MECFLNDLAGASLSEEHEERRAILGKKIMTIRKISPPSLSPLEDKQEGEKEEDIMTSYYRPRALSCTSMNSFPLTSLKETREDDKMGAMREQNEISREENEESVCEPQDEQLDKSLRSKKTFERLRQAYLDSLKVPRRRSASEPQVRTSQHRQPNPEYIKSINTCNAFVFEVKRDTQLRKPNKKGFNVAWEAITDVF